MVTVEKNKNKKESNKEAKAERLVRKAREGNTDTTNKPGPSDSSSDPTTGSSSNTNSSRLLIFFFTY